MCKLRSILLGKNVPLDLDLKHDNNYLKKAEKNWPAMNEQSVARTRRNLKISREVIENLFRECQVMKRSVFILMLAMIEIF